MKDYSKPEITLVRFESEGITDGIIDTKYDEEAGGGLG